MQNAEFKASPVPMMPTDEEISAAYEEAVEAAEMNPSKGARLRDKQKAKRLANEICEAVSENDSVKATNLREQLQEISRSNETIKLEPDRERFEALVAEAEEKNANSKKGSPEIAAEIRKAAAAGVQAYENSDQEALTEAVEKLQKLIKSIDIKPHENNDDDDDRDKKPPQWQLCGAVAYQTNQFIEKAMEKRDSGEFTPKFCAQYLDPNEAQADKIALNRAMKKCMGECRMLQSKDCSDSCEMWRKLVELYRKWYQIAILSGIPTGQKTV